EKAGALLKELQEPGSDVERLVADLREGDVSGAPDDVRKKLEGIYRELPPELKVTFVERGDYRRFVLSQEFSLRGESMKDNPMVLPLLKSLNENLLREDDMTRVLQKLMDAAVQLAGAENGFLVLKNAAASAGPLPGYEIAVARNVTPDEIGT